MLALAGCGGGSDDASTAGGGVGSGSSPKTASSADGAGTAASEEEQGENAPEASSNKASAKAKHGPHIAPPKGPQAKAITPTQEANATVADISLQSPNLGPSNGSTQPLPAAYTCDGTDTWPELRWGGVPAGTEELILFAMNLEPIDEAIFFDWALAGIDPSLEAIESAKLPKGTVQGRNGFGKNGYSICPPGEGETYVFALYALPKALTPARGFDPTTLRKEALDRSGNAGLLAVSYARG